MSKILTIHSAKESTGEHWFDRLTPYDFSVIEKISDPKGGKTKEPPTSIPSPFARFDLVKTAFARLAISPTLKGEFNDERLVSESLDVAQIFFNADKFQDRVTIIPWSKGIGIDKLKHSQSLGHRRLARVFDLFLTQDGGPGKLIDEDKRSGGYNFDFMHDLYILKYELNGERGVIGGTSPSTLFFSSPNSSGIQVDIMFGKHRVFSKDPCPLHERENDFIQFMFGISRLPDFSKYFPELSQYIVRSEELLVKNNFQKSTQVGGFDECLKKYNSLTELTDSSDGHVEIINGFKVKKASTVVEVGEFILETEKFKKLYPDQKAPMLLADGYQGRLKYTAALWDRQIAVPHFVQESWNSGKRRLPGVQVAYPWLTVNDLFEPVLFKLIYPLNSKFFFDPMADEKERSQSFLIPLKPLFFDFFNADELASRTNNKVSLSIKEAATYVDVSLSVLVKAGEPPIVLSKRYLTAKPQFAGFEVNNKEGYVEEVQFAVNMMPFVRFRNVDFDPLYHISLFDRDISIKSNLNQYSLVFFDDSNKKVSASNSSQRRIKQLLNPDSSTTHHYTVGHDFDLMQISIGSTNNMLIPRFFDFTRAQGTDYYRVSIDFGTTNTHVEINSDSAKKPVSFGYKSDELMHVSSIDFSGNLKGKFERESPFEFTNTPFGKELIPASIGENDEFSFPIRTVAFESKSNADRNANLSGGFHRTSPGFYFQKKYLTDNAVLTNLKWTRRGGFQAEVEAFLDSLLFMARNKVLLNNGKLGSTTIIWFYALSMPTYRRDAFNSIWDRLVKKNFGLNAKVYPVLESSAPFYFYKHGTMATFITAATYPVANIDIGGETADIVIYQNNKESLISSFRFAGNTLFGDGFDLVEGCAKENGFIRKYQDEIEGILDGELKRVYDDLKSGDRTDLLNSFFFSLKGWQNENGKSFDYQAKLSDDEDFKIIFFLYYYALIYHLAQIFVAAKLDFPRHITFSGKGAELISILSNSEAAIAELTVAIFEMVSGRKYYEAGLNVHHKLESKKQATCKGAILQMLHGGDLGSSIPKELCKVHTGFSDDFFANNFKLSGIDSNTISQMVNKYHEMLNGIDELNSKLNLKDKFGVPTGKLAEYNEILSQDVADSIKDVLDYRKNEGDESDPISETLFFYPLIPALKRLMYKISSVQN